MKYETDISKIEKTLKIENPQIIKKKKEKCLNKKIIKKKKNQKK